MSILVFTGISEQLVGKYVFVTCSHQKNMVHSTAIKNIILARQQFLPLSTGHRLLPQSFYSLQIPGQH